ncbi:MAG TPA: acyl carrier protein [Myxococcota bacterium]|nr:acyl carrier protein [Myxococcota bacterium]
MRLDEIREIVVQHARLSAKAEDIGPTTDLYSVGLSSLTTVHLMLALEDHFSVEFPNHLLSRKTFESLQSIAEAIAELTS